MGQYDRVLWRDGIAITRRQRQALVAAEKSIQEKFPRFQFDGYQGSWRPVTSYSGTTHTDRGVCDLGYWGISDRSEAGQEMYKFVLRQLRRVGCQAAFGRGPWNNMSFHYHICDLDTAGMDFNAVWQVGEYRKGFDGLDAGHDDPFPYRPRPIVAWKFKS